VSTRLPAALSFFGTASRAVSLPALRRAINSNRLPAPRRGSASARRDVRVHAAGV